MYSNLQLIATTIIFNVIVIKCLFVLGTISFVLDLSSYKYKCPSENLHYLQILPNAFFKVRSNSHLLLSLHLRSYAIWLSSIRWESSIIRPKKVTNTCTLNAKCNSYSVVELSLAKRKKKLKTTVLSDRRCLMAAKRKKFKPWKWEINNKKCKVRSVSL